MEPVEPSAPDDPPILDRPIRAVLPFLIVLAIALVLVAFLIGTRTTVTVDTTATTSTSTSTPPDTGTTVEPSSTTSTSIEPTTTTEAPTTTTTTTTAGDPWVRPEDTGIPAGTVLKPQSAMPPQTPGVVYDGYQIGAVFRVTQPNVTIKNSRITGNTTTVAVSSQSTGLVIDHSEISCTCAAGVGFDNYTITNSNIFGFSDDGLKLGTNVRILSNWIHDAAPQQGAHADGIQQQNLIGPPGSEIRGNLIAMGSAIGNSAVFLTPDLGGTNGGQVIVADNFMAGGNFTITVLDGNNGQFHQQPPERIVNNVVVAGAWRFGPVHINEPVDWFGNRLDDGTPISP